MGLSEFWNVPIAGSVEGLVWNFEKHGKSCRVVEQHFDQESKKIGWLQFETGNLDDWEKWTAQNGRWWVYDEFRGSEVTVYRLNKHVR